MKTEEEEEEKRMKEGWRGTGAPECERLRFMRSQRSGPRGWRRLEQGVGVQRAYHRGCASKIARVVVPPAEKTIGDESKLHFWLVSW